MLRRHPLPCWLLLGGAWFLAAFLAGAGPFAWRAVAPVQGAAMAQGRLATPARPSSNDDAEGDNHLPIYVQDSPAAQQKIERARSLRAQGRMSDAVAQLQRVVEQYPHKLQPAGKGLYESVPRWVSRYVAGRPKLLTWYRRLLDTRARRALNKAVSAPPAQRIEKLAAVFSRYFLTKAGLDAGLDLAAAHLEAADARAARAVLDEAASHPDLADHADRQARYQRLAGAAALLAGDQEGARSHQRRLEQMGRNKAAASVAALARALAPPADRWARATGLPALPPPSAMKKPLWRLNIEHEQDGSSSGSDGGMLAPSRVMEPTADGRRLYFNEGQALLAVDRFSGRRVWTFTPRAPTKSSDQSSEQTAAAQAMMRRRGRRVEDRRGVLLLGERVLAVVGTAVTYPSRLARFGPAARGGGLSRTSLVCLDRDTGRRHWRLKPEDLGEDLGSDFEDAFFLGTPLAASNRVLTLMRRTDNSGLRETFVVAVNAATGRPVWRRQVLSTAAARGYGMGASPRMTLAHGMLYVRLGRIALAAVDSATGTVKWTRIATTGDQAAFRRFRRGGSDGSRLAAPVMLPAGLLVPPLGSGDDAKGLLLDPEDGSIRRSLDKPDWSEVDEVLPTGNDVLTMGSSPALLNGQTLEPIWSTSDISSMFTSAAPGRRAAVTTDGIVMAYRDGMGLVSRKDGSVPRVYPDVKGGDLLALDGQVVVTSHTAVRSYMPFDRAHKALLAQVREHPDEAEAGLGIAYLALTTDHHDVFLQGVDAALSAVAAAEQQRRGIARPGRAQQRVFTQLLAFADPERNSDPRLRRALLDRLSGATASPAQEAMEHFARGRLFEDSGEGRGAVEQYQTILLDPKLETQMYHRSGVLRQAGIEARRRLKKLVREEGTGVYRKFDHIAHRRLAALTAQPSPDPQKLIDLANRYPLADAAPRALIAAAAALRRRGRTRQAVIQLRRAYQQTTDRPLVARIVGRLAQTYEQDHRPRRAMSWLRRVHRAHPGLKPIRDGRPVHVARWLADLRAMPASATGGPTLTLPLTQPLALPGRPMTPAQQPRAQRAGDRLLTLTDDALRLYAGKPLRLAWRRDPPSNTLELLWLDHRQLLLWDPPRGVVEALDPATGKPAYPPLRAKALLAPLRGREKRRARHPAAQRRFMQLNHAHAPIVIRNGRLVRPSSKKPEGDLVAVSESVVCLADRRGGVVAVDRRSGEVVWRTVAAVDQVSRLEADSDSGTVVVAGVTAARSDAQSGVVQALDLHTGQARLPLIESEKPPQWVGFAGDGLMLIAASDRVTAHRLSDGAVVWRVKVPDPPLTGEGWASADLAVLALKGQGLIALDAVTGQTLHRANFTALGGVNVPQTFFDQGQWQVLTPTRAVALGPEGRLLWRDAIGQGDRLLAQLVGGRYVVLVSEGDAAQAASAEGTGGGEDGPAPGEAGVAGGSSARPWVYVLDRVSGLIRAQHPIDSLPENLDAAPGLMLDDRVVLSAGDHAIVIPGSAPPSAPPGDAGPQE